MKLRWSQETNWLVKGLFAVISLPYLAEVVIWSRHLGKSAKRKSFYLSLIPFSLRQNIVRGVQFWIFRLSHHKCLLSSASVFLAQPPESNLKIVFGVKKTPKEWQGHCWLSSDSEGQQDYAPVFQIL